MTSLVRLSRSIPRGFFLRLAVRQGGSLHRPAGFALLQPALPRAPINPRSAERLLHSSPVRAGEPEQRPEQAGSNLRAGPLRLYGKLVSSGRFKYDPNQRAALEKLQDLHDQIHGGGGAQKSATSEEEQSEGFFSSFFPGFLSSPEPKEPQIHGMYLYGGVGTGKTTIMDLLYDSQPDTITKRRTHFYKFMLDVHARMHELRKDQVREPLKEVAKSLAEEAHLLCFDEFQVTDVADAMVLKGLFTELFELGVVFVATSNREPDMLYKNGLNRSHFLPFIKLLKERCVVHQLDGGIDYRKGRVFSESTMFHVGSGTDRDQELNEHFLAYTGGNKGEPRTISVKGGRFLKIPVAFEEVAWISFDELCKQPLGPVDYIALTENFHTIFVSDIPKFDLNLHRNEMRRFITLIDVLYEAHVRLVCSSDVPMHSLYTPPAREVDAKTGKPSTGMAGEEENFAFDRTLSRLVEMQSKTYLENHSNILLSS